MRAAGVLALAVALSAPAWTQAPAPQAARQPAIAPGLASFDVASVRRCDDGGRGGSWQSAPEHGRWTTRCIALSSLIAVAFQIPAARVVDGPKWDYARLSIIATTRPDVTGAAFHQMLQSLLVNRFQFAAHWEMRPMKVRSLEAAPGGIKVSPPSGHCAAYGTTPADGVMPCGRVLPHLNFPDPSQFKNAKDFDMTEDIRGNSVTMADMVQFLGMNGEPMVDNTGYKGTFDIDVHMAFVAHKTANGESWADQLYKIPAALKEQAGLMIKETTAPLRVLVVDHYAQPTAN